MASGGQEELFFICVAIYEATSNAPDSSPLYEERFTLVTAPSQEAAVAKANRLIASVTHRYRSVEGNEVAWTCKQVIDVAPLVDNEFVDGAEIYGRYFRDFAAYEHFEPRLKGKPLD